MKKKYITGLLMAALSAMLFTGCGFSIGKEIPLKDLMVGSIDVDKELVKDALSCLQIQAVSKGKDGIDKDALSDADTTYAAQEEVADTDAAASDTIEDTAEDAQDQSDFLPDGFTVSYSCDYFTDYDNGDVSVRINEGEIDSDIQNFLDGNGTSYYGTYQLSRIGVCDLAAGSVAIIEGEGNSVYKYFLAGGGVNMEIMKSDGSKLSADECVKYLNLFAD